MRYLLFICLLINQAEAFELRETSIQYDYMINGRNLLISPSEPTQRLSLDVNTDLGPLFWDNSIVSYTDSQGFRSVGWEFYLGGHLTDRVDLYYRHISEHVLDREHSFEAYPFENSIGVKLYFYKKE